MEKFSKSPDRNTFQKDRYLARCKENNEDPNPNYLKMFDNIIEQDNNKWISSISKKNNLEWDLVSTEWIVNKTKNSDLYAQNLYAALCNNLFKKIANDVTSDELLSVLTEGLPTWSCSWRSAGGIVADMQGKGDYIDWYCSGISNTDYSEDELLNLSESQKKLYDQRQQYVTESTVTEEIEQDLKTLGWLVCKDE